MSTFLFLALYLVSLCAVALLVINAYRSGRNDIITQLKKAIAAPPPACPIITTPIASASLVTQKTGTELKDEDYHIIKGFMPETVLSVPQDMKTFTWDHVDTLMEKSTETFIWITSSIWGGFTFKELLPITKDTKFINAPSITTYIKKTPDNKFLSEVDTSYILLGFKKGSSATKEDTDTNAKEEEIKTEEAF